MSSVCRFVLDYIEYASDLAVTITNANLSSQELWNMVHASQKYSQLNLLFEKVLSSPSTSAPVERVFSSSGMLTRRHHTNDSYKVSELVYCKTRQEKNLL